LKNEKEKWDESFVYKYDLIREVNLEGKILELGTGNRMIQLLSKHKEYFMSEDYLGYDLYPPNTSKLNILKGNILELDFKANSFDLIICFDVLEHIRLDNWLLLSEKIKKWLVSHGLFIFTVPYNEVAYLRESVIRDMPKHIVFGIREKTINQFFSGVSMKIYSHPYLWGISGENLLWRICRGMKRVLKHDSFMKHTLYCKWVKRSQIEVR